MSYDFIKYFLSDEFTNKINALISYNLCAFSNFLFSSSFKASLFKLTGLFEVAPCSEIFINSLKLSFIFSRSFFFLFFEFMTIKLNGKYKIGEIINLKSLF